MHEHIMAFLEGEGRGIITSAELKRTGMGPSVLRTMERAQVIVRVARGVYVLASRLDPPPQEVKALGKAVVAKRRHLLLLDALLRGYAGRMAASHQSAALAWGLPVLSDTLDLVRLTHTRAGATGRRYDVFRTHSCEHEGAFTVHDGRRIVVPPLAIIGTAMLHGMKAGLIAADAALRSELTTREDIEEWLDRKRHHPGLSMARQVAALAQGSAESAGETLLRLILVRLGIRFEAQHWIRVANGQFYRVDFYLPDLGVVLEFDGLVKYAEQDRSGERLTGGDNALAQEKKREDAIRGEGYGVGRVVWSELSPDPLRAIIEAAARQAHPSARGRTSTPPAWSR